MIAMHKQYNSIKEVFRDMQEFLAIDYPVRCTFDDDSNDVIIGLPFEESNNYGVFIILIDEKPKYGAIVGRRFEISFEDFQIMNYEPIKVTDFNWQAYLPEKKRLQEEDE